MKKRIISMALCICMLISVIMPVTPIAYAVTNTVEILHDGTPLSQLPLPSNEKKTLTAEFSGGEGAQYQWQLLLSAQADLWVDIYDKTQSHCEVSYALVKNLLDASGSACIRCEATQNGQTFYSDPVCVSILPEQEPAEAEQEMILLADLYVLEPEAVPTSAEPTEESSEPTEESSEPTEESSEPTEESSEPTEESSEPTEESSEPTEESSEPTEESSEPTEETDGDTLMADFLSIFALQASAEEVETEYVTITIKYLDESSLAEGAEEHFVYSPYTATIEKGSDFSQTVISPTYLGFAPYWDENGDGAVDEDGTSLAITLTDVAEDVVYYVYYKPIKVNFAVRYFFQNVNDDLYTENANLYHTGKAETGTIITDTELQLWAGDTTGFVKMYHKPEAVAADGSTIFECYYDRNYYLIQFNLDGGYGVDPIYARYGTPFVVNDPVKHGYTFVGWDLVTVDTNGDGEPDTGDGKADTMPATISAESRRYTALWQNVETTYSIVYWLNNGDGTNTYIGTRQAGAVSSSRVSGTDDLASVYLCGQQDHTHTDTCRADTRYYEFVSADTDVLVEGDGSTVVNVYYTYKAYELRFYYAMSSGSGTGTTYYVIGGSTYRFGASATISDTGDEVALLDHYMGDYSGQRGQVDELPTLNANGTARGYTHGTETSTVNGTEYTYHYISFRAKYNSDISQLWPCNVFNSVTRVGKDSTNGWSGTEAFVSAWNGEHHVYYSQHNGNQTIKGNYMNLDYQLLWDYDKFGDSNTVSYLCFWENGANISWSIPELYRYNIYVPLLSGQSTDGLTTKVKNNVTYYLLSTYDTCDDSNVDQQTAPAITGYKDPIRDSSVITDYDTSLYQSAFDVNFYYTRENYDLTFFNYNSTVSGKGGTIPFGSYLEGYYFVPDYPSTLEENAYKFAGWYTTSGCYDGSEFGSLTTDENGNETYTFTGCTMPAGNLTLYAKWIPKTHQVNFFTTYQDMRDYEAGQTVTLHTQFTNITHGAVVGSVEEAEQGELIFSGWFYMENGEKKAFSPTNMPITRDMNIYADWNSNTPQPYRIEYVLKENRDVKVAEDSTGYAYVGSTRTFTAKAGSPYNQLYAAYNKGYFPIVNSHSIVMQYEGTDVKPEEAQINTYTFEYVKAEEITYRVRYLDKETNAELAPSVSISTYDSVVTERFLSIPNYVPDAFYKRLVLSVVWDEEKGTYVGSEENEILFYYTPNQTSAYYAVHFMLEKAGATDAQKTQYYIDGTGGYEETGTIIEGIGTKDTNVPITPQTFPGFTLIPDAAQEIHWNAAEDGQEQTYTSTTESLVDDSCYEITVTENGTELYIFYERLEYPYAVYYYKYNTTEALTNPKLGVSTAYGATVTESAPTIEGYTCVSAATQSTVIREETDTDQDGQVEFGEITQNVIIFYYAETQYTVEYVPVPAEGGWLSNTIEVKAGTEAFTGSAATANQFYAFEGWYLDEACTQPVRDSGKADLSDDGTAITPIKSQLNANGRNIFYAKFVTSAGDLTITRTDALEADQVFVYKVESKETGDVIYVTITGNGSATIHGLPYGNYTVTQQNGWSWRYSDATQTISHEGDTTVQFKKPAGSKLWLNGNSPLVKNRKKED